MDQIGNLQVDGKRGNKMKIPGCFETYTREEYIEAGGKASVYDEWKTKDRANNQARKDWWGSFSKNQKRQFQKDVDKEYEFILTEYDCSVDEFEPDFLALFRVRMRYGFKYPYPNLYLKWPEKYVNRFVDLVTDESKYLKTVTVVKYKPNKEIFKRVRK